MLNEEDIIYLFEISFTDLPYCAPQLNFTAGNVSYWQVRLNVPSVKLNKNTHTRARTVYKQ